METTQDKIEAAIATQAAQWFVVNREGELSAQQRGEFTAWLRASPVNVREYLAVSGVARDFGTVSRAQSIDMDALAAAALTERNDTLPFPVMARDMSGVRQAPRRQVLRWSIAAAICALVVGSPSLFKQAKSVLGVQQLETAHGEQRVWRLDDGTIVHLNSGSQISIHFSGARRLIHLSQGQALFDVARDPSRQFKVETDDGDVQAVGTSFDVYKQAGRTVVTVLEGKVLVNPQGKGAIGLTAGQQLTVNAAPAVKVAAPPPAPISADLPKATAWTQQQIVFEQESLADVVREFNRYGRLPLEIEDEGLRALRITGIFNAYDTESFIGFLKRLQDVNVEERGGRILIAKDSGT